MAKPGAASVCFFLRAQTPIGSNQGQSNFRGFIAKITLTLLADSERLPSKFLAGVDDFVCAPS
jgi:hypothetical protein